MAKTEKYTAHGATVEIGAEQIVISGGKQKIILPDGTEWGPVQAAAAVAVQAVATNAQVTGLTLAVLQEIVGKLGLKPGDVNHSKELLPDGTVLAALMEDNGDALITIPQHLPKRASWNRAAEKSTEQDIRDQLINVHHLFVDQGANDYGYKDWRLPNLTFKDSHDESYNLYQASGVGALKGSFDKSGSSAASTFWSARRYFISYAYFQWVDGGNQDPSGRVLELPVRPVRRVPLSPSVPT